MKKTYTIVTIILCIIILVFIYTQNNKKVSVIKNPQNQTNFDGKNATFEINSELITLVNGKTETPSAPNSASKNITTYFGNEATGDLNGDGLDDIAFLITQSTGGSGLFYYTVVAMNTPTGYKTTNAVLVGDRIAPQSTEINSRELHVNFAKRNNGEPMTVKPSQGAVLLLEVTSDGVLKELVN